jgi:hypothetical protein
MKKKELLGWKDGHGGLKGFQTALRLEICMGRMYLTRDA